MHVVVSADRNMYTGTHNNVCKHGVGTYKEVVSIGFW